MTGMPLATLLVAIVGLAACDRGSASTGADFGGNRKDAAAEIVISIIGTADDGDSPRCDVQFSARNGSSIDISQLYAEFSATTADRLTPVEVSFPMVINNVAAGASKSSVAPDNMKASCDSLHVTIRSERCRTKDRVDCPQRHFVAEGIASVQTR